MEIYIFNIIAIFALAIFLFILVPLQNKKETFLFLTFIQLLAISAMRFEVGVDFINYKGTFNLVNSTSNLMELLEVGRKSTVEYGYLFLNKIVGLFTDEAQWIFIVTSFIILYLIFKTISRHSSIVWLSVYIFTVGAYISSLNIVRQYIAVGIVFFSYRYIIEKKFIRFLGLILIASLFHTSALLILPLYFILNINLNAKRMVYVLLIGFIMSLSFNFIFSTIQRYFYNDYTQASFGMTGGNIKTVMIALIYFILTMICKKSLINRSKYNNILINWSFLNLALSIFSLNTWIITRLMAYSSIFLVLLIPEIVVSIKNKYIKIIVLMFLISLTLFEHFNMIMNPINKLIPYQSIFTI